MDGERGRVLITGGTGMIGRRVARELAGAGHDVVVLTRSPERAELPEGVRPAGWDGVSADGWGPLADGALGIVHLAGENIADGRWTAARKRRIRDSRVRSGEAVTAAVEAAERKPKWLLQASGVDVYGDRGDEVVGEGAAPGEGFLAEVCIEWEASTEPVERLGVRRAVLRSGPVLTTEGGMLGKMLLPFKLGLGGPAGSGEQYVPWIHMADEVAAIRFLAGSEAGRGPFNLTAPEPVSHRDFAKALGRALGRPAVLPAPGFALKIVFGEMADLLLEGKRAVPRALETLGFRFRFPQLEDALRDSLA